MAASAHTKALYDTGANLIKESVATSRDYCKALIATSFGAIPIYLSLIKLFLKPEETISSLNLTSWWAPIALFFLQPGFAPSAIFPSYEGYR